MKNCEIADGSVFVPAAESARGGRVSEASAAEGGGARGSVPHAPHWWVESCEAERGFRNLHMKMPHHILSLLVATTDYLNNLSPDSKEYEDTQGTINRWRQCVDTVEPYWPALVALCYRVISLLFGREREPQESQFRFPFHGVDLPGSYFSSPLFVDCNV